jgi:hypothetical protein
MNVYLIKTPEYEPEKFREVVQFLQSFNGPVQFKPSYYDFDKKEFYFLQYDLFPRHPFHYPSENTKIPFDSNRGNPLSWRELFHLCQTYRERFHVEKDDFVVLLTNRKNALNWFCSGNKYNNIFVQASEWENYTRVQEKFPVAHSVVSVILQILMKLDIENIPNKYLHEPPRGCMNDFCQNKEQIIIKMQTANICPDCIRKIRSENISQEVLVQFINLFSEIRNNFIFHIPPSIFPPSPLVVESNGKIHIIPNNIEIKMTPLFKTLYIFYLKQERGVSLIELINYRHDLLATYCRLRPSASLEDASKRIDDLIHPLGDSFNSVKTHVNRIIKKSVPAPLVQFYLISGKRGNPYHINIPRHLVDIRY